MAASTVPALIEQHILYAAEELRSRLRWTRKSWDAARKRGLKVLYSGKRAYVKGSDAISFIETDAANKAAALAQEVH